MALADIPFYGAYTQRRQMNEQAPLQELQQAGGAMSLLAQLQKQEQAGQLREALAATGGDVEKALEVAVRTGNIDAAHQLAPLVKLAQERRQGEDTRRGLAALQAPPVPEQPQELGMGQPVSVAGEGRPAAPQSPTDERQARIAHLDKLTALYANNPQMMRMIEVERGKLEQQAAKPEEKWSEPYQLGGATVQKNLATGQVRTAVSREPAQEQLVPVKESDGRIIYVPRSQAAGREVGSRQTDMNIYKQVQQLGRDFEKANLNTMIPVVERAMQITKEQAGFITGPKGALPDMALPDDVVKSRQALQKLFNITLKDRSGAAVTYQELERLKQEFGAGFFKKPEQLLEAIREARNIVESHYAGVAATHGKDALDRFNENLEAIGGVPFRMSGRLVKLTPVQGATAQPGAPQPQQSGLPTVTNEAEYNALPSGAVYVAPDGKTKRKR